MSNQLKTTVIVLLGVLIVGCSGGSAEGLEFKNSSQPEPKKPSQEELSKMRPEVRASIEKSMGGAPPQKK